MLSLRCGSNVQVLSLDSVKVKKIEQLLARIDTLVQEVRAELAIRIDDEITYPLVYTNGISNNMGAAWAVIIQLGPAEFIEHSGIVSIAPHYTQMQILAVTEALRLIEAQGLLMDELPAPIPVYTPSKYVYGGLTEWIHKWQRDAWISNGKLVKYVDYWRALANMDLTHVDWRWASKTTDEMIQRVSTLALALLTDTARR